MGAVLVLQCKLFFSTSPLLTSNASYQSVNHASDCHHLSPDCRKLRALTASRYYDPLRLQ